VSRSPDRERDASGAPGDAAPASAAPAGAASLPTSAFEYTLPPPLIARQPAERRDESRLLVVDRARGTIAHHIFRDLPDFIPAGDALVLNETRVFPARLVGKRAGGGEAEVFLLRPVGELAPRRSHAEGGRAGAQDPGEGRRAGGQEGRNRASRVSDEPETAGPAAQRREVEVADVLPSSTPALLPSATRAEPLWTALVRPGSKLKPGRSVEIGADLTVHIVDSEPDGTRIVRLETPLPLDVALERYGRVPLPPYIDREAEAADVERYQTVYARERGSVAAPTAGLHFTPAVLRSLEERGVELVRLVLHVGVGTFRPVEVEDTAAHRMHAEWYRVPAEAAASLNVVRERGGRVWAVGTTVTRTLETVADAAGRQQVGEGWTDIFIRPPYHFRAVDRLITNFHLPRSTLLMLVSAFAGRELVLRAYEEAIRNGYRFYSYGDAMLLL